jgi:hypothetical protein
MARKSKDVIAQAAKETAAAEEKKGRGKKSAAAPSNVTEETITRAMDRIMAAKRDHEKAQEAAKQANGVYRSAIKAAKQDGIPNDAILLAVSWTKEDAGEVVSRLKWGVRIAKNMGLPVGTQLDIFSHAIEEAEANPYNAGQFAAGNREPSTNNPHHAGSAEFVEWDRGFMDKMASMAPSVMTNGAAHA